MTVFRDQAPQEKSEKRRPDPGVAEVGPGILRIMLPIDLPGLGHVNCYALPDEDGVALIDPGMADGVSFEALCDRLTDADLDVAKVHTVVSTHSHFDHFGGVARLRRDGLQPQVIAHRQFGDSWRDAYGEVVGEDPSTLVERSFEEIEALAPKLIRPMPWGGTTDPLPPELLAHWGKGIDVIDVFRPPRVTHTMDDGDRVTLGGRAWELLHTPGHADDHLCLWNSELGILFAGDHVLPTITPHISGFSEYPNPLGEFFASLDRVGALDGVTQVLPAHGDPFSGLADRSTAIYDLSLIHI